MNFSKNQHKNLIISAIVATLIVVTGFYVNQKDPPLSSEKLASSDNSATTTSLGDRDSDEDGLPDWEEALYGTNPRNPDTDGDGTNDGDEVRSDRNPNKPYPNDSLTMLQDPNFSTTTRDIDALRKEFFERYLAEQGNEIRETTYRDLIDKFDPIPLKTTNDFSGLIISGDNGLQSLRAYGNEFGKVIDKYTSNPTNLREENIIDEALKTKSGATLKELQLPAIVYKNFSEDLRAIQVPSQLAGAHLLVINGYDGMGRGLLAMQGLFSDAINGAAGYQTYSRSRLDVTRGYSEIVSFFIKNNVTFSETEPGYPFYFNTISPKAQ